MTKDEFQRETNDLTMFTEAEAQARADEYNRRGVDGDTIVAAQFGGQWCLMLYKAYRFTQEMGIT